MNQYVSVNSNRNTNSSGRRAWHFGKGGILICFPDWLTDWLNTTEVHMGFVKLLG